ncbi:MAG: polyprenyl synthetase family protein [Treponema sp.]|jgi:octaprenyl-diphosphate synthase|nr:polyprenyl synthetase family protein [Treponema sp.]
MHQEYSLRIEKIEAALRSRLPETPDPSWAAQVFPSAPPVSPDMIASLTGPGRDLINRGGKRWRPLLMTLVCESLGGGDAALPLVPLVEFCHNASLIHDDIEDGSGERRGKPSVHLIYGLDAALNGGCFLYFLAPHCIDSWTAPGELKNQAWSLWTAQLRQLHLGQAMDIRWHRDPSSLPGIDEYLAMTALKTGALAQLAARLGVIAAVPALSTTFTSPDTSDASTGTERFAEVVEQFSSAFGEAAEKLGIGFQILDDVKNLSTGNPGKQRGDDVVEGKKSLPVLLYLHRKPERRDLVLRCFGAARTGGAGVPEVEELIGTLEKEGVLEEAASRGRGLIREGSERLGAMQIPGISPHEESRRLLAEFAELIV